MLPREDVVRRHVALREDPLHLVALQREVAALLVATVTVLAFDLGMGGWMLVLHFNELMPPLTSVTFVFLMQIGIVLGFLTGYPAVALLLKRGTKVAV